MKRYLFLLISILIAFPAMAENLTVTNNNDAGAGSFRQAVVDAQPGDHISFSESFFYPEGTNNTIVLDSEIVIDKSLSIEGPVDSDGKAFVLVKVPVTAKEAKDNNILASDYRLFTILGVGHKVGISNLRLKGGDISELIDDESYGAVIYVDGPEAHIENIEVSESTAYYGGAIHKKNSNLYIKNSFLSIILHFIGVGLFVLKGAEKTLLE